MTTYLAIAIGGAAGAVCRYWLSLKVEHINSGFFPLGTFTVNVIGCFIIGAVFILFAEKLSLVEQWRPLIVIGFLGALTTFSTFSLDALLLFQQGHYNTAVLYMLASVAVCLMATYAGMQLTRIVI